MDSAVLRRRLVELARRMVERELISSLAGNLSARMPDGNLLVTPSGVNKAEMPPDSLLVIDTDGNCLGGDQSCTPTSELPMHLEVYRRRPEAGAVIHAHPISCVALSLAGISLLPPYIPEALVILGPVPTTPYATPASTENRDAIAELIETHDAIILAHHGSLTVGRDIDEAYYRLEILEHTARTVALAHQLGGPRELTPAEVAKLLAVRERLGYARPGEDLLRERIAAEVKRVLLDLGPAGW